MIYMEEYNTTEITEYSKLLKKEFNLLDAQRTNWIKITKPASTPLLIAFKENKPLIYLDKPGEQAKIKLHKNYERPKTAKIALNMSTH